MTPQQITQLQFVAQNTGSAEIQTLALAILTLVQQGNTPANAPVLVPTPVPVAPVQPASGN